MLRILGAGDLTIEWYFLPSDLRFQILQAYMWMPSMAEGLEGHRLRTESVFVESQILPIPTSLFYPSPLDSRLGVLALCLFQKSSLKAREVIQCTH